MRFFLFSALACCFALLTSPVFATIDRTKLFADFTRLASDEMAGRRPGTQGHDLAQAFLIKRFSHIGLKAFNGDFKQRFTYRKNFKDHAGVNLIGYIEGSQSPDKFVVVTAHYDHLGTTGNRIYNGADDNASGVAALLALASSFSLRPPRHSIIFFATDAEEDGLKGSMHFVKHPPVSIEDIVLNINMDMIANGGKKKELFLAGRKTLPQARPFLAELKTQMSSQGLRLKFGHDRRRFSPLGRSGSRVDWTNASDHGPFNKLDIPYLYFGVDIHHHYHKPSDTVENADMNFYLAAVQTIYSTLKKVDSFELVTPQ